MFIIEGNIGAGKSTLINNLQKYITDNNLTINVVQEPVDKWLSFQNDNNDSILSLFYNDIKKYAFSFQMYVMLTRFKELRKVLWPKTIVERSLYTDKEIFTKALTEDNNLSKIENKIIDEWVDELNQSITIHGLIYLKIAPKTCYERIRQRSRTSENNITIDYLTNLHNKHESYISNWISSEKKLLIVEDNDELVVQKIINFIDSTSIL